MKVYKKFQAWNKMEIICVMLAYFEEITLFGIYKMSLLTQT